MSITSFNGYSFPYIQSDGTAGGSYNYPITKSCVTGKVKFHIAPYSSTTTHTIRGKVISSTQLDALEAAFVANQDVVSSGKMWKSLNVGDIKQMGDAIIADYTAEFEQVT